MTTAYQQGLRDRGAASSTSGGRLTDAKIKAERAKFKAEQMEKTQELKIERIKLEQQIAAVEAEHDVRQAEVEVEINYYKKR